MTWIRHNFKYLVLGAVALLVLALGLWYARTPKHEEALPKLGVTNTLIRQEVNITDAFLYAGANAYATSSEIAAITDSNYSSPAYYFEVVASTTAGTTASVDLVNATSSKKIATVSITGGNTYQRYRSAVFGPSASSTVEYAVRLNNENIGKGIIASRIVVLQNAATLSTETQIEIGNNETYTSTGTTTFASPKYWYYNSAAWDASPTFYAEVTYASVGISATSTDVFSTAGAATWSAPPSTTVIDVAAWGGGGDGWDGDAGGGGAGGGGGAFASSTLAVTGGITYALTIGAGGIFGTNLGNGGTTTFATTTSSVASLSAAPGWGGKSVILGIGLGGNAASSTGQKKNSGGNGGQGANGSGNNDQGGGGGGSAGPHGAGAAGTNASGTLGGDGGKGDNNFGGAGGGNVSGGDGAPGTASTNGGGGGAGGDDGHGGGLGATYGGAGGGGETFTGTGGAGAITIAYRFKPATTTIVLQEDNGQFASWADVPGTYMVTTGTFAVSTSTRVRSGSFTPTNGKHYRIAFANGNGGATQAIYNAKIVAVSAPVANTAQMLWSDVFGGNGTFTTPSDVTRLTAEATGAGGGGTIAVGGGGGGAYASSTLTVTASTGYAFTIGASGVNTNGGDSTFNTTDVVAKGGKSGTNGGTGGTAAASTGTDKFSGGNGVVGAGNAVGGGGAGDIGSGSGQFAGDNTGGSGGAAAGAGFAFGGGGGSSAVAAATGAIGAVRLTYWTAVDNGFPVVYSRQWHRQAASQGTDVVGFDENNGDLLLFLSSCGAGTQLRLGPEDLADGWVALATTTSINGNLLSFYKFATTTKSEFITQYTNTNCSNSAIWYVIKNAASLSVATTTGTTDPPALTPAGGAKNYLWIGTAGDQAGSGLGNYTPPSSVGTYHVTTLVRPDAVSLSNRSTIVAEERLFNAASQTPTNFGGEPFALAETIAIAPSAATTYTYPTLLEPQYLLADTKFFSGTALQNFLTLFDPTEWNTTNNYMHAVSSGPTEASTIEIDNTTGPAQIVGSVITSPNNYATSTGMCLSSNSTLDTKATINGGKVYSSSIIVQVGTASTASCSAPSTPSYAPRLYVGGRLIINQSKVIVR